MSKIITINDAVEMIRDNVKGTTIVSIDTSTEPKMRKTANPFYGNVRKLNTMTGMIGFDYQSSVNRLAAKEDKGEREAKSRAWGTITNDRLFVEHKGEFYIQMKVESSGTPRFILADTGETVEKDTLAPWLSQSSKSSTQSDLDGEVIVRDVKMVNVKSMRFRGETYTIVGTGKPFAYASDVLSKVESVETETETEQVAKV